MHTHVHLHVGALCAHTMTCVPRMCTPWTPGSELYECEGLGAPGTALPIQEGTRASLIHKPLPLSPLCRGPMRMGSKSQGRTALLPQGAWHPDEPHTDLVSHPDSHRGLQNPGLLVKILPCVFWEGVSARDRGHLNVLFFFIFEK